MVADGVGAGTLATVACQVAARHGTVPRSGLGLAAVCLLREPVRATTERDAFDLQDPWYRKVSESTDELDGAAAFEGKRSPGWRRC